MTKPSQDPISDYASRESALGVLRSRAKRLREQAEGLEALADELEDNTLSSRADEALWALSIHV
jgi:hypothetical protein